MQILDYEKCVLSLILRFCSTEIPKYIIVELQSDKFDSEAHKRIYQAMSQVISEGESSNPLNVSIKLGPYLNGCGGIEYLESLIHFLPSIGVEDYQGYESWVRVVHNAGRLRQLADINQRYSILFDDFENLVNKTQNVDEFLSNYLDKINSIFTTINTNYKHISTFCGSSIYKLEKLKDGEITEILPCDFPSLASYLIPRPATTGVIAGLSSMGKTQLALQIGYNHARSLYKNNQEGVVSINSLETSGDNLVKRIACMVCKIDSRLLDSNQLPTTEVDRIIKKIEDISNLPLVINDSPDISTEQFVSHAIAQGLTQKRSLGISDYLELFRDDGDSEELRVSKAMRNIRQVCWKTGSCEIVISQFNNSVLSSRFKIGGMFKTRYSGAISHAADWFIEVWNPVQMRRSNIEFTAPDGKNEDYAYLLIEKNKDYPVGEVSFDWIPEYKTFLDHKLPIGYNFNEIEQDLF